jgi:hypothetical protein
MMPLAGAIVFKLPVEPVTDIKNGADLPPII